jgi:uncharacterized membrane protein
MNLNPAAFGLAFVLLPLLDLPWILLQPTVSASMFQAIQGGRKVSMKFWPAVVVYLALAFLLIQQTSITQAALSGAATYAVYDFTNLAMFKNYSLSFAIMDSIWGGILMAMVRYALDRIF